MKKYITVDYGSIRDFVVKVKQQGKHEDELINFRYVDTNKVKNVINEFTKLHKTKDIIDFTQEFYK